MKVHVVILAALTLAAGCASAPTARYYTLDMAASGRAQAAVNLTVDRIRAAEPLARRDILIKKTPTEIEYYASEQWAAGLDELVAGKLLEEFGPVQEGRKGLVLSGVLQDFEQVDVASGAEAHVKLAVEFRNDRYGDPVLSKTYEARVPAEAANAPAVVVALSRCLEQIAAQIAADAGRL